MPALSPTMQEGTLSKWLVKKGDKVSSGDLLAEIETDKAVMEFESAEDGIIEEILIAEGTEGVKVNSPIASLREESETIQQIKKVEKDLPQEPNTEQIKKEQQPTKLTKSLRSFASPLARRLISQNNLDIKNIHGSGPKGRIVRDDVKLALSGESKNESENVSRTKSLDSKTENDHQVVPLTGIRKTIASRLLDAKQTIPHFYLRRTVKVDKLIEARQELNKALAAREIKISINDLIMQATIKALKKAPECNVTWGDNSIIQHRRRDVSMAVAIKGGLITPVVREEMAVDLSTLSQELKKLIVKSHDRKLATEEYSGGTITVSNLGMMGIENFDAIINPPQASILAVGSIRKVPKISDGLLSSEAVMSLTLSVDHRMIDGAMGANFLGIICDHLEQPITMLG